MNKATIEEKIIQLNIHHIEKRIKLELENLEELKNLDCVGTKEEGLVNDKCNFTADIIKYHWRAYEKLPGVDTKCKIQFLAANNQLIDLLDLFGTKL